MGGLEMIVNITELSKRLGLKKSSMSPGRIPVKWRKMIEEIEEAIEEIVKRWLNEG